MRSFRITGGHWIFYVSAAYFVIGMGGLYNDTSLVWLGPLYVLFLSLPFLIPPLGRAINLDIDWDIKMFDWFKGDKDKEPSNVVKFPDHRNYGVDDKQALPLPEKKEEPATIYYRFGITDKNRLAFQMGYSEITMNKQGVQNLIDQLTFFMNQLENDHVE